MTEPAQDDGLLQRYREASAQDTARPGAHVQASVRAHAEMMIAANRQAAAEEITAPPAANQSSWRLSALAGVAVLGLSGLLFLQFERASPEEKDTAFGQQRQGATPTPPSALPEPANASAAGEGDATSKRLAETSGRAKATARATPTETAAPVLPAAQAQSSLPPPAAEAAPSGQRDNPTGSVQGALAGKDALPASAPPAMAAPSPAAATAATQARAIAPRALQKSQSAPVASADSARARAESEVPLSKPLLDAARSGSARQLADLLQQGAPMNSVDEAGRTPLMLAAMQGHADTVRQLLAAGARITATDKDGLDAAQLARRQGFEDIARLIESPR